MFLVRISVLCPGIIVDNAPFFLGEDLFLDLF